MSQYFIALNSSNKEVPLTIGKTILEENNQSHEQIDTSDKIENKNSGKLSLEQYLFYFSAFNSTNSNRKYFFYKFPFCIFRSLL